MRNSRNRNPPRLLNRFLEWYCADEFLEDLQGDLHEYYNRRLRKSGKFIADLWFVMDVIRNMKPHLAGFRNRYKSTPCYIPMLFHNLKTIKRTLIKNKFYAGINIAGLAIGIAGSLFIWEYVRYELSFENFHSKSDDIYRITMNFYNRGSGNVHWARTPDDWVIDVIDELPEVKSYIRFQNYYPRVVKVGEKAFKEEYAFSTDSSVFSVFDFKLLEGNPRTALKNPFSVVLTESLAKKYFGDQNPLGEQINILDVYEGDGGNNFLVTGIMEDVPSNTHLPVNLLTSFNNRAHRSNWAYSYLYMEGGTNHDIVEKKLPVLVDRYAGGDSASQFVSLHLYPLKDIHLHSNLAREIIPPGDIFYVKIFSTVGVFILLMAIINFTNLSISRSMERAKEIGVRKVLGSGRSQLFRYFLLESIIFSTIASFLAIALVLIFDSYFFSFTGIEIQFNRNFVYFLIFITLFTGSLGGLYPALIISSFKPIKALKKHGEVPQTSKTSISLRHVLLGVQFTISLVMLSSAIITWEQFNFLSGKNLGFDKEQVLAITNSPLEVQGEYEIFKSRIEKTPGVNAVSAVMEVPSREIRDTGFVTYEKLEPDPVMDLQVADTNFLEFMNVELIAGRGFSESLKAQPPLPDDAPLEDWISYLNNARREYLINESGMKLLGVTDPQELLGKEISWNQTFKLQPGPIVGVISDFHQETLRNKVDPTVFIYEPIWLRVFLIKLETSGLPSSLASIDEVWKDMFPDFPMESAFLDDLFNQLYESEQRQKEILSLFSSVIILIAILGLLGLISFMIQKRMKELAIRKILGASSTSIIYLFGKTFIVEAFVSLCIAAPVTSYFMQEWLNNFAYHISLSGIEFIISFLIILFALSLILVLQVGRSTNLNPVETLRYD